MTEEISLEDYKKAYREILAKEEKREFTSHLVMYVLTNAMLIAINFIFSPETIWFFYPLVGWGIGVLMYYLFSVRLIKETLKEREARVEYRAREKKR